VIDVGRFVDAGDFMKAQQTNSEGSD